MKNVMKKFFKNESNQLKQNTLAFSPVIPR